MKLKVFLLLALLLFVAGCTSYELKLEMLPLLRGINMGNALEAPREGEWGVVIKDEYFKIIKNAGFSHVRIPIRWSAHADLNPPYTIEKSFFDRVDHVVNEALRNNLFVVINIHHYEEIMQYPEKHKNRFLALWKQIAEHYKDYPNSLIFELLNEPCMNLTSDLWNKYLAEAIKVIRVSNPDRFIVVGPVNWNSVYALRDLRLPKDEKNIIVTFHYYNPFYFTHQGAEWVQPSPPVGVKWWGREDEKAEIDRELDMAVEWSIRNGKVPLYMGEFGAYSKADMDSRVRWTSYVARSAEKRGIAWAYWEFCAGFGAFDPIKNEWRIPLLKALIPETKL
ncbi:MAG: glycoside hydrolase family 5 protein [Dictyoglomus turgidum]|uniref:glycoside hydrolase family 5 protein n=1 Tax=Dictyoglomus turgidum TaxID=513050 RepID=UPI003C70E134